MLARSFRLVAARLIPRLDRRKQALLLLAPILAGCGASGQSNRSATLAGRGFRFTAPDGWQVTRGSAGVAAQRGADVVRVATFPLARPYRDDLFTAVTSELSARMQVLAGRSRGTLSPPSTLTVDGMRAHSYRIEDGGNVDQYTFVLRGRREYLLICRRRSSSGDAACRQLLATFRTA